MENENSQIRRHVPSSNIEWDIITINQISFRLELYFLSKMKNPIIIISLAILILAACKDRHPNPVEDSESLVWVKGKTDTTVLLSIENLEIPAVIHIPDCGLSDYAAIVIMHGSSGMWKNVEPNSELSSQFKGWQDLLNQNCLASIIIDSYSPRGTLQNTGDYKVPPKTFDISAQFERPKDAYAALEYLSKIIDENHHKLIRIDEIGVLGFSHGGSSVECTIFDPLLVPTNYEWQQIYDGIKYSVPAPPAKPDELSFAAAVVYYPGSYNNGYFGSLCQEGKGFYLNSCPLLMHLAENDPLTENSYCFIQTATNNGGNIEYYLYEGADHSFDNKTDGINGQSKEQARTRTLQWFKKYLTF